MKRIFKSTAQNASRCAGPLQDFDAGLLAKGMKPDMALLTLARKIAAIRPTSEIASSLSVCRDRPPQVYLSDG